MVYPLARPMPPHGSTAWGAAQIYRLLDEEERVAAERPMQPWRLISCGRSRLAPSILTSSNVRSRSMLPPWRGAMPDRIDL
jgi:hypothetical protein